MIAPHLFHGWLQQAGVTFYAGVPDSLLKDLCAYVTEAVPADDHVICVNEGCAVAMAMGHHLATGRVGVVYLQNSGLGNTVNPLTSLADAAIYAIPMLLIVGWRGEPGVKDEPQHVHMGGITEAVLTAMKIDHTVLPTEADEAERAVSAAVQRAREASAPQVLLVRKNTFAKHSLSRGEQRYAMTREQAIERVVAALPDDAIVVATTGKPARELFEVRARRGQPHRDLLIVGGMGHASQVALAVAKERSERTVVCLDGDGAALMHLGGLATIGTQAPANYRHVLLNNGAHDSVGGQPTVAFDVDLCAIAKACGYRWAERCDDAASLESGLAQLFTGDGPRLLEARVQIGARADLGRPTMSPGETKDAFVGWTRDAR